MEFDQHAKDTLVDYLNAHLAWKRAPAGQAKVDAKQARGKMHSKVLELAELIESQAAREGAKKPPTDTR